MSLRICNILVIPVWGSYCMVCGGIVTSVCMFADVVIGSCCGVQSLWLAMSMVIVFASSLVGIRAQWMASRVVWQFVGYARLTPVHREDFACPNEPNNMSRVWGE